MADISNFENLDLRDFTEVSGLNEGDNVLLLLDPMQSSGGTAARVAVSMFKTSVSNSIKPSIVDGYWWIGSTETDVQAEGLTPQFKKGDLGIYWKYTKEADSEYRLLVNWSDIKFKFEDLTDEQRQSLILRVSDMTDDEIKTLQQPANDMIAVLAATNATVELEEAKRVAAETERVNAETTREGNERTRESNEGARIAAETARDNAETARDTAEKARDAAEQARETNEGTRQTNESTRITDENTRKANEETRKSNEEARITAESARATAETARDTAETARMTNEQTRQTQEQSRVDAETARVNEFATLKDESVAATDYANEVAQHPTYVGEDNYIYEWNHTTKTFDKTYKLVKAGGLTIDKTYKSVAELEADTTDYNDGCFAMVNTGNVEDPEDARLYIRNDGKWEFVVDMSGAIGLTGKTPQLFIGTVSLGKNIQDAGVSLSAAGTDEDGNPMYNINYTIPRLVYDDLTEEQIAELQQPANDMIAVLAATNDSVRAEEAKRVEAENVRKENENTRQNNESTRQSQEDTRQEQEATRETQEATRESNETARIENESTREQNEATRKGNESERQDNEQTRQSQEITRESQEDTRQANENTRQENEETRQANEQTRKDNEDIRKENETTRQNNENTRQANEDTRQENEETRQANEQARQTQESTRQEQELDRMVNEENRQNQETAREVMKATMVQATEEANTATEDAIAATANANSEAERVKTLADNPPNIGENGNWYAWDETAGDYADTGILAKGGVMYPSFLVDDNAHLWMSWQNEYYTQSITLDEETGHITYNFFA
jgi:hypothetical protein